MRDVIAWEMLSLDGYFDTDDHQLDWFFFDEQLSDTSSIPSPAPARSCSAAARTR